MSEVFDFDTTAANNNDTPPDGFPENMAYSAVNDAARELMAAIARDVEAKGALTTTTGGTQVIYRLTINQDVSGGYQKGMWFAFVAHQDHPTNDNPELNVNSQGSIECRWPEDSSLYQNCYKTGEVYIVVYDGTYFRMINYNITDALVKNRYEGNSDTNAFTDAYKALIDADLPITAADIRTFVDAAADSNVYTDVDKAVVDSVGTRYPVIANGNQPYVDIDGELTHPELDFPTVIAGEYQVTGYLRWNRTGASTSAEGALNKLLMRFNLASGSWSVAEMHLVQSLKPFPSDEAPDANYNASGAGFGRSEAYMITYDVINEVHAVLSSDLGAGTTTTLANNGAHISGYLKIDSVSNIEVRFQHSGGGSEIVRVLDGSWFELRKIT